MKYCEYCGGKIEGSCPTCAGAPYDAPPVRPKEIGPPTLDDVLSRVSIIGFEHVNGETHTLVSLQDVRKALGS